MSGRLKHKPSTSRGNNEFASANQQTSAKKKNTRSRTDSGERLKEEDRPIIEAAGENWEVHPYLGSRKPPTVIGALVRERYPDFVDTANGKKPVLTWEDFKRTRTLGETNDRRVVAEFWWRFNCLPEKRVEADKVLQIKFTKIVPKMLSEEKQAAIKRLYSDGRVPSEDVDENGKHWPTKEALISAKPKDFTSDEGWALLCEHWSTPDFRRKSFNGKHNRQGGGNEPGHRGGSRSLPATRQFLAHKTGVDPGLGGAWLHNHKLHPGTNDSRLCNQSATDRWAQYEEGMEKKYGPNWRDEHTELDPAVIYECVGRMPHGTLGIADGAISITEKEQIKTRKRCAQPYATAREKRLERENKELRKKHSAYLRLEHVVWILAANGGMDYDALNKEAETNLANSESEVALPSEHEGVGQDGVEQDINGGKDCSNEESEEYHDDEENEEYNYDNDGYSSSDNDKDYDYYRGDIDEDYDIL